MPDGRPTDLQPNPRRLIAALLGPAGPELTCEQCFELLDVYVEHELAGADAAARIPGMREHLQGCLACAEEHDSLRDMITTVARRTDTMSEQTFVIAGASLAGAKAAEELRERGFDGRLVLVGEDPERPYIRPPLTKDYLRGESEREKAYVHAGDFYASHEIELLTGTVVSAVDPAAVADHARRWS